MKTNKRNKYAVLSIVFLVFGFIVAYSYSQTNKDKNNKKLITDGQYLLENKLLQQLIEQQAKNEELQKELFDKQAKVRSLEKELFNEEQHYMDLAEEAEKYRMFLGKVKVRGQGVEVTLEDAAYKPETENINQYIVHEHHIFQVINELYTSGASAVAVNGQRINKESYILCSGPVITVDGNQFPAPFTISAIGDPDVLVPALTITGGVRDQLVNENIVFTLDKKKEIVMEPLLGASQ